VVWVPIMVEMLMQNLQPVVLQADLMLTQVRIAYLLLVLGLSNAIQVQSTITGNAKQECQEPNIAADGNMTKIKRKARQVLAAVRSVAIGANRASLFGLTKLSVDSVSGGSVPRTIGNSVAVVCRDREARRVTNV